MVENIVTAPAQKIVSKTVRASSLNRIMVMDFASGIFQKISRSLRDDGEAVRTPTDRVTRASLMTKPTTEKAKS